MTHFRTCNLCEAMCGLAIEHEGTAVSSIRGDRDDPFSRGHLCPKAVALQDLLHDPDRLRFPMRRTSSGWERIGWEEAYDEVARRLVDVRERHGRKAVAVYQGNPTVHNLGAMTFGQVFVRSLKSQSKFSATSVDQLPRMLVSLLLYGHQLLMPVPDLDRTDFLLMLGANPAVSNGSIMSAPDVTGRLKALVGRGGSLVVVDPRRTETATLASRHLFIRPGTDALLLGSILHVLFEEQLVKPGRLSGFLEGMETIRTVAGWFSPEATAPHTGIEAEVVRKLTRDFAAAKRAVCYGRVGISTQEFGTLANWFVDLVNILTGNLDREGGSMFALPAVDVVALSARMGQSGGFDRFRSRVRGLPEFGGELPVAVLAEEIETEGPGQIRALVTSAGNPVLSCPDGRRIERALERLEFMVSIDFYLNETTRHAHIILPPTSPLEHDHYDLAFHLVAIRNTAKYSTAMVDRPPEARHDWEIYLKLAARVEAALGAPGQLSSSLTTALLRRMKPAGILDLLLRLGPYGRRWGFLPGGPALTLDSLKQHPHGIDLGPLESMLPKRLYTPTRTIHLAPDRLLEDLDRLRGRFFPPDAPAPPQLSLVGRRELRSNNSWMHNSRRLMKGPVRCTLQVHPRDAERTGTRDSQEVELESASGKIRVVAEISDQVMEGVVCLPHGWGHHRPGIQLAVAAERPGVSFNDLADDRFIDELTGNASFSGIPVTLRPVPSPLPQG